MKKSAFFLFLILASCHYEKTEPDAAKTNLTSGSFVAAPWMNDIIKTWTSCVCDPALFKATYKDTVVYFTDTSSPTCNSTGPLALYNANGDVIKTFTVGNQADYDDRTANLLNREVVYKCGQDTTPH